MSIKILEIDKFQKWSNLNPMPTRIAINLNDSHLQGRYSLSPNHESPILAFQAHNADVLPQASKRLITKASLFLHYNFQGRHNQITQCICNQFEN